MNIVDIEPTNEPPPEKFFQKSNEPAVEPEQKTDGTWSCNKRPADGVPPSFAASINEALDDVCPQLFIKELSSSNLLIGITCYARFLAIIQAYASCKQDQPELSKSQLSLSYAFLRNI